MAPTGWQEPTLYDTWATWTYTTYTTTASTSFNVWPIWCDNGTASISSQLVWQTWTSSDITTYGSGYVPVPESDEVRERRLADAAERRRLAEEAKVRARVLLREVLDEEQEKELEAAGHFHVHTKDGERTYRLKPGSPPMRIKGEDGSQYSYCIHPLESYPTDDVAAAFKLLLEADEERFLQIANASRTRVPV